MVLTTVVTSLLVRVTDQIAKGPEPEDVKAGWIACVVFLLLAGAVVLLLVQPGQAAAQGAGGQGRRGVRRRAGHA